MNNEIIQLKVELRKRSRDYLKEKGNTYAQLEGVENAIDHVFNDEMQYKYHFSLKKCYKGKFIYIRYLYISKSYVLLNSINKLLFFFNFNRLII
jgi:hypothetical protein